MFRGDDVTFTLCLGSEEKGRAWLRTNLGHARIAREEIIQEVRDGTPRLGHAWFDIPMKRVADNLFRITLPLCEVGHFEAKCFFLKQDTDIPFWPGGANVTINVAPSDTLCANTIYNTFVRQFGPNKQKSIEFSSVEQACISSLDKSGWSVIPPSGTFRDLIPELDFIIGILGCRFIQLLPIHPTPTTYGRMGRFGSPYAALSFTAVDPALAQFDPKATPLEQFIELVDAVHARNAKVLIDIAINHTGWAADLHESHPKWLARDEEGRIEMPGAWGVCWADLTRLDYSHKEMWQYMADIFLTWCRRGVDGIRCDAGYMIPISAWKYITACVREQYPDIIFLLEGLGGKVSVTKDILNLAGFEWAYSELFQNYNQEEIESYLKGAFDISKSLGLMVHYAETHDNNRLAAHSKEYARMRTALCALFSSNGAFGFAGGVEWFATEKIIVHEAISLNWGAEDNQVRQIRCLTTLIKVHPCFHDNTELTLIHQNGEKQVALLRNNFKLGKKLMVLVNLDEEASHDFSWNIEETGITSASLMDLLTGTQVTCKELNGHITIPLLPCQVFCLTQNKSDLILMKEALNTDILLPERIKKQRQRAKALDAFLFYHGLGDINDFNPDKAGENLAKDPVTFLRDLNPFGRESRVVIFQWPVDINRDVMVPQDHFLMIKADSAFRARIMEDKRAIFHEKSMPCDDGSFFALFQPMENVTSVTKVMLKLSVYDASGFVHDEADVLYLPGFKYVSVQKEYSRKELLSRSLIFSDVNGIGGLLRANVSWGKLDSKYDALLAANLNPSFPSDRWIMLTRCRAFLVFQGYSQDISCDCLDSFTFDYSSCGIWNFNVPSGQGEHVALTIRVKMLDEENSISLTFLRHKTEGKKGLLEDHKPVRLILRPDIEDRNFHETTKAYTGPEHFWPEMIHTEANGFRFTPDPDRQLFLEIFPGTFVKEPEWLYMVHRTMERERGMDSDSDLFSPGYFFSDIKGGESVSVLARVTNPNNHKDQTLKNEMTSFNITECNDDKSEQHMEAALDCFLVRRGGLKSVIAGYPWFLDWGRDSLIFTRGLVVAGRTQEVRDVLMQFGRFEARGTLPNMIRGEDARNRDTSDAPLWFSVACNDLADVEGTNAFFNEMCGNRTISEILVSIADSIISGTPGNVRMDSESGLVFSPSHFTWMDTNYPAGTPREGYPIEIQALWYHSLYVLSRIAPNSTRERWKTMGEKVKQSIIDLFYIEDKGYLSDCLHCSPNIPASQAEPDDALRPNQLFAITLSAVDDKEMGRHIVESCAELLVPGAIRSLAHRPVKRPLEILLNGERLNDPYHPYQGRYHGDEDTIRKPAYHNGTAWTWVFPSFCEAWVMVFGREAAQTALSWLGSSISIINDGCVGMIPEILDGDSPHQRRGCDAQAWGVSEFIRVKKMLESLLSI
ncbi:MAG: glycogen debranching protein [Desulfobacterales bacterium]|nr:glycogen debranching protein [Desulfobacterales bacterium]